MSLIALQIDHGQTQWQPGAKLGGIVTWEANPDHPPATLEVRLFWHATGGSAPQIGLVETVTQTQPPITGTQRFEFLLPAKPWSFQGRLAALNWAIEAVLLPERVCARAAITVGPNARVIQLHPPRKPPPLPIITS